uniref:Uncharacterized protein n=1 Tax=Arundo donax TaxID=35708 RepID=A0A0A9GNR4_ARUDO
MWNYENCHGLLQRKIQPETKVQVSPMLRSWQ